MIEKILIGLAVGILDYFVKRKQQSDAIKYHILSQSLERIKYAMDWKNNLNPDDIINLRVSNIDAIKTIHFNSSANSSSHTN